jgi:hypothetical protein
VLYVPNIVHYVPNFQRKTQNLSMFQSSFVQYFLDRERNWRRTDRLTLKQLLSLRILFWVLSLVKDINSISMFILYSRQATKMSKALYRTLLHINHKTLNSFWLASFLHKIGTHQKLQIKRKKNEKNARDGSTKTLKNNKSKKQENKIKRTQKKSSKKKNLIVHRLDFI